MEGALLGDTSPGILCGCYVLTFVLGVTRHLLWHYDDPFQIIQVVSCSKVLLPSS